MPKNYDYQYRKIKNPNLDKSIDFFISYISNIMIPAGTEFLNNVESDKIKLHQVFGFNLIVAQSIDYQINVLNQIKYAIGNQNCQIETRRSANIKNFDEKFFVQGTTHITEKFQLMDAVNNSYKHIELDDKRYSELTSKYGAINFNSLKDVNGIVMFQTDSYSFDYCRVVLRPIFMIYNCKLSTPDEVIRLVLGQEFGYSGYGSTDNNIYKNENDWDDPIDQMIAFCHPTCQDCGESDSCKCDQFKYDDQSGEFKSDQNPKFNFDEVMSKITGTRYK